MERFKSLSLIVLCVSIIVLYQLDTNSIVTLELGSILGSVLKSEQENEYYAFRGIRYAKPPIDNLRWKDPVPITEPWLNKFDAREDGPICWQGEYKGLDYNIMSEDCLRINVYTKNINGPLLPVFAYIHGGRFLMGSNNYERTTRPSYIMDNDVVYVTFQYRLGTLGFLSSGTADMPGNIGFKDQVLALKWIQTNIDKFGGDPNRVTLGGHSSGAMSVSFHMVSPMSKGLFHRAILMSGSGTSQLKIENNNYQHMLKLAKELNCDSSLEATDVIACLRNFSPLNLTKPYSSYNKNNFSWFPYNAVIEPDYGQTRFLVEDPVKSILNHNWNKVPVLIGITKDECAAIALAALNDDNTRDLLENSFEEIAPNYFMYERDTERSKNITAVLKEKFLPTPLHKYNSLPDLEKLYSDGIISYAVHRLVKLICNQTDVYYYKSTYIGRYSNLIFPDNKPYGVLHEDDLQYLLVVPNLGPLFHKDDPEYKNVQQITRLFLNFVKNGNPNDPDDNIINSIAWSPYNANIHNYLDIGEGLVIRNRLFLERFNVWDELFPITSYN